MPAQTGSLCFDAVAEPKWDVPVATIGGLPIAVIDRAPLGGPDGRYRARPAQHRAAPARLHFRRTVRCSRCAPATRGSAISSSTPISSMPTACRWSSSSRFSARRRCQSASRPPTCSTTPRLSPSSAGASIYLLGATEAVVDQAVRRTRRALPGAQDRRIQQRLFPPRRRRGADHRRYQSCQAGHSLARARRAGRAIVRRAQSRQAAWRRADQDVRRPVRFRLRQEHAGAGLDATARSGMGLSASILSRAASPAAIS